MIHRVKPKKNKKFKNLAGKKFNHLLVLYRTDDYISKRGYAYVQYMCLCECGNERVARASALREGKAKSCGCVRAKPKSRHIGFEDLTGQRFGLWTALFRAKDKVGPNGRKATMWRCVCDCGTEKDIRQGTLKSGSSKSCGCLRDNQKKIRDLVGQTFGRWTVLHEGEYSYTPKGRRIKMWFCLCECGTSKNVSEASLVQNKSISCGCYRKEQLAAKAVYEDISGNKYGSWLVLNREPDRFYPGGGRATMWRCECSCGTQNVVAGNMLKSGISKSCGCQRAPYSEEIIRNILNGYNIKYEAQKKYDDLLGVGGGQLSYDFLVYNDDGTPLFLLEYQGEQHFRPVEYFGGVDRFLIQQEHDALKRKYALDNNIELVEISYTDNLMNVLMKHLHSII